MSYVRFNDAHDDGQLSQFRERLAAEVRAQTGEPFEIFQDRNDIAWGQNWQQRINETLDAVTLLLVIVTPSLFRSPPCRDEFRRFLDRERHLGRSDLILPVYYISAREMDDEELRAADDMATVLATRQFADWRELRFEAFTSPAVRRAIAQLAGRMRDVFWRPPDLPVQPPAAGRGARSPSQSEDQTGAGSRVTVKTEPPTHVVDPFPGRGHFTTVSAAIAAAQPGDRILVRPGVYGEGLVVDKPLEILGDGPLADVEIRVRGAHVLLFQASMGRVANLTLRQAGPDGDWCGVAIIQGRLELEGCDIASRQLACVRIQGGADPRLRRNKIHGSSECGVLVSDGGLGTVEDNDITGNAFSGVEIVTGGNPTVRGNQIHDNKQAGIYVHDGGLGTVEDNDITGNGYSGVVVKENGNCVIRGNRINRNREAVRVAEGGHGVVEDNDLTGNARGPWDIEPDCEANVTRTRNQER